MSEFTAFPKLPRLNRDITITEKLDGTNAQIYIDDHMDICAGSRNRWIYPGDDNYGFARWVEDNKYELLRMGPGQHFGEWWGQGIQRKYGLIEKRFSLFNSFRWSDRNGDRPDCCSVVPVLYEGPFDQAEIKLALLDLSKYGSFAAPRFMNPEGIVIFHQAANMMFKVTCKDDEKHKSQL